VKKPGDINSNRQRLLRLTDEAGTDYNARVWVLKCGLCSHVYGCNSTDAWERKCPKCQRGKAGLSIPVERDGRNWTRQEHILAFNLYCKIPFGRQHSRTPEIIDLAKLLRRSANSVALKLNNFSRLDPELQARGIKGMAHGAKGETEVWREFEDNPEVLAFESERLLAQFSGRQLEQIAGIDEQELPKEGLERERMVRVRVNQHFFRAAVLAAYDCKCCITGLAVPELLVASHIVPWATDPKQRMNPRNGLCLNALHDRAFDRRLMFFDRDFKVRFHTGVTRQLHSRGLGWLLSYEGKPICMPLKFRPDVVLIEIHAGMCARSEIDCPVC
jgi:putative restriction endonuclease